MTFAARSVSLGAVGRKVDVVERAISPGDGAGEDPLVDGQRHGDWVTRFSNGRVGGSAAPACSRATRRRATDPQGLGRGGVGVRPAGDLTQVAADAGNLPGALALHRRRHAHGGTSRLGVCAAGGAAA